jgi:cytochrome c peroxidase
MKTRKSTLIFVTSIATAIVLLSFRSSEPSNSYIARYYQQINHFKEQQNLLVQSIRKSKLKSSKEIKQIVEQVEQTRHAMKAVDFWLRYLEPISYKKINGPLPVEWETEVFEKFEKPYKREGAGLTLARMYLDEPNVDKDSLLQLVEQGLQSIATFTTDSTTQPLSNYHHFYLCNRLFLLNLAAIYTTGFECPDTEVVVPELRGMINDVNKIYQAFNESYPDQALSPEYMELYSSMISFVHAEPNDHNAFDHFTFLRDNVNPLFKINQQLILKYHVSSRSVVDYSLNKASTSIFDKALYHGQNAKGIFTRVKDSAALAQIDRVGKLLFYDPILSGNNERSCASCHRPSQYFTETSARTSLQFDHKGSLARNTPSLINAPFNHLLMLDGKHISLQDQTKGVIVNPQEMGSDEMAVLGKVLSCEEYKAAFTYLLKYTPQEKEITLDHVVSAITMYYTRFSNAYAPFDDAMNGVGEVDASVKRGFNLFAGKAQCATCHFVPQFNGVKPPYVGSEFEVLGVPEHTDNKKVSPDKGRFGVNEAFETLHAFRTGTLRNAAHTMPYMHNGVFKDLEEVIDFYNEGGGAGRGLDVSNQTLSPDPLELTAAEKNDLIAFIKSLDERVPFEKDPTSLPLSNESALNKRIVGGSY